jgi:hypothetical protein
VIRLASSVHCINVITMPLLAAVVALLQLLQSFCCVNKSIHSTGHISSLHGVLCTVHNFVKLACSTQHSAEKVTRTGMHITKRTRSPYSELGTDVGAAVGAAEGLAVISRSFADLSQLIPNCCDRDTSMLHTASLFKSSSVSTLQPSG